MKPSVWAFALLSMTSTAFAGPAGDTLKDALYAGALTDGLAKLEPMAAGGDTEAAFGVGALKLTQTVEHFVQALYRHGFAVPRTDSMFGPGFDVPIPQNPNPEPMDYAKVRDVLADLVAGADAARVSFVAAGQSGDYVIDINPLKIRVDANGDDKVDISESLGNLFAVISNTPLDDLLAPPVPGGPSKFEYVGFDRADAFWLAGYTQVIAAQADFLLAHDFSDFVNALFHRLFPKAGFPMQDYAMGGMLMLDPQTDTGIADLIAGIHTINWPVVEPARLAGVRERLKAVLDFSHQNWDAIMGETDSDHELLPSPKQTAMFPDTSVDAAKVAAWLVTLEQARKVLDGELLIPHWRFKQGFDLKAYFETAKRTDLVMLLTGAGALPFIKDGQVARPEDFRDIQDAFGNDWLGYAFWFN
ncbi:MAG: hypothetical protein ABIQ30_15310 [Devosia sp.]